MTQGADASAHRVSPAVTDGQPERAASAVAAEAPPETAGSLDTITLTQIMALKEPTRTLTLEALNDSGERSFYLRAKGSAPVRQRYGSRVLIVPPKDSSPKPFLLAHALHILWYDLREGGPKLVEEIRESEV